jgi:hypothetical protein
VYGELSPTLEALINQNRGNLFDLCTTVVEEYVSIANWPEGVRSNFFGDCELQMRSQDHQGATEEEISEGCSNFFHRQPDWRKTLITTQCPELVAKVALHWITGGDIQVVPEPQVEGAGCVWLRYDILTGNTGLIGRDESLEKLRSSLFQASTSPLQKKYPWSSIKG